MVKKKTQAEIEAEKKALEFVNELQTNFTEPIINKIDEFLNTQSMEDKDKHNLRQLFLVTIGNSMLLKANLTRRRLKDNYYGLLNDYDKLK